MAKKKPSTKAKASTPAEDASFEQIFSQLEHVVGALERGERPLSESLTLFEEGIRLCRLGTQKLDEAERTVELLMKEPETGEVQVVPYEGGQAAEEVGD